MDDIHGEILTAPGDKTEIPPLHQKRILAFVNHFLITTCTFLNEIALTCETRFIELERKLQKVEAALVILESKLATIPDDATPPEEQQTQTDTKSKSLKIAEEETPKIQEVTRQEDAEDTPATSQPTKIGVPARDDIRYKKFFKMVQVGVPVQAVKLKMQAEGLPAIVLDTPDVVLTDGIHCDSDV